MRFFFQVLVILFFFSETAHSEESVALGFGATPCAEYLEKYKENPSLTKTIIFFWAQGYFSGMNMALFNNAKEQRDLSSLTQESLAGKINIYCYKNSIFPVLFGLDEIFDKLNIVKVKQNDQ